MLNVSIALYLPDWILLQQRVEELLRAEEVKNIYLIDNSPAETDIETIKSLFSSKKIHYLWNKGEDIGFGRAHNIAIRESVWQRTKYHLVMSTGIEVQAEDIDRLHWFMEHNPQVGQVMPKMIDAERKVQYQCRLLPSPIDVFLPVLIREKRRNRNVLLATGYDTTMNVPSMSASFMFLRTEAALEARLFDERYTMYAEHIDMTRTIHRKYLTLYLPDITITNNEKQIQHNLLNWEYIVNMIRYFNKWGWIFDAERNETNRLTLQLCMQAK